MTIRSWERIGQESVSEHGIFRLHRFAARSTRTGRAHDFTVVETANWVNVVAVTKGGAFVLVRQYRHGVERVTLEIPGGIIDPGEAPADAAVRELREETGYAGSAPVALGVVDTNPAVFTNRCHTFLIRDCERVHETEPDAGEHIETLTMDEAGVRAAIADGRIAHALVLCGLAWHGVR
ncbi:NUDIX hydrolase [bacterium]|nr:NUDIX hydrolase [bacterium]